MEKQRKAQEKKSVAAKKAEQKRKSPRACTISADTMAKLSVANRMDQLAFVYNQHDDEDVRRDIRQDICEEIGLVLPFTGLIGHLSSQHLPW